MSVELNSLVNKKVLVVDGAFSQYGPTNHEGTLKSYNVEDKGITLENVTTRIAGLADEQKSDKVVVNWRYVSSIHEIKKTSDE